jgi:hypothetical protein
MNDPHKTAREPAGQPTIAQLFARYLEREALSPRVGDVLQGEVLLHESPPAQPVDARVAQESALSALRYLSPEFQALQVSFPRDWPSLVANVEPAQAVPLAAGNFPQMLRDLHTLLETKPSKPGQPVAAAELSAGPLMDWVEVVLQRKEPAAFLLGAGVLRLGRYFNRAEEMLDRAQRFIPAGLQAALGSERAALAWHRGDSELAAQLWRQQPASTAVHFNRGLAALFLGQPAEARSPLHLAIAQIPEVDPWYHLGQLYLALAEIRQ